MLPWALAFREHSWDQHWGFLCLTVAFLPGSGPQEVEKTLSGCPSPPLGFSATFKWLLSIGSFHGGLMLVHIKALPAGKWHLSIHPSLGACQLSSLHLCAWSTSCREISVLQCFLVLLSIMEEWCRKYYQFWNIFKISVPVWIHAYTDCLLIHGRLVASAEVMENLGILWLAPCATNLRFSLGVYRCLNGRGPQGAGSCDWSKAKPPCISSTPHSIVLV